MTEPFKNLINTELIRACGQHLQRAWPEMDARAFVRQASRGLDDLEMKARAMQVADALEQHLPADFEHAAQVIEAALAPPLDHEAVGSVPTTAAGLAGWIVWPVGEFVARRGIHSPELASRALCTLRELTMRFSAEFAIRPFIARYPQLCWPTLAQWSQDPNAHVRRLVSEGSRPRLPWGMQLKSLIADPSPTLPLLRILQDDGSAYVRRSVANHLNDIAKDHPDVVTHWLTTHLPRASPERQALLRHASRTLIKQGHAGVLTAWGLGCAFEGAATFTIRPARVLMGDATTFELELTSSAATDQALVVDTIVHRVLANGSTAPKVFKGWKLTLGAGEQRTLTKIHSLKPVTTRTDYPGRHRVELQINGAVVAVAAFVLVG